MAQIILTKNGTGSAYPQLLSQGELAINVDSGSLYYGTSGSSNAVSSSFVMHSLNLVKSGSTLGHMSASGNISASTLTGAHEFGGTLSLRATDPRIKIKAIGANHPGLELYEDSTRKWLLFNDPDESDKFIVKNDSTEYFKIAQDGAAEFIGNVTASIISSSGTINADQFLLQGNSVIGAFSNGSDYAVDIGYGSNTTQIMLGRTGATEEITIHGHITASGHVSMSLGKFFQGNRKLRKTPSAAGECDGDVVFFGTAEEGLTKGAIHHYVEGNWVLADADAEATAKGLLGVAISSTVAEGICVRGTVTLLADPGSESDVLYLSTTAGRASSTVPSGNGDIVRVVGYCLDSTNAQVYFCPDNTFVEVSA